MLWGITSRINENKDYIKDITFTFKSGLKEYKGSYNVDSEKLSFNGIVNHVVVEELGDSIADICSNYEALELVLNERGKSTILV